MTSNCSGMNCEYCVRIFSDILKLKIFILVCIVLCFYVLSVYHMCLLPAEEKEGIRFSGGSSED